MHRRTFLKHSAALAALTGIPIPDAAEAQTAGFPAALRQVAHNSGKILGMYIVAFDVGFDPLAASLITREFSMVADGNDLKFSNRLRPTPDTYNFVPGEWAISWAQNNGLLFRGHTLVWHNALPNWFQSYVTKDNAQRVMTEHITNVVRHYAGKVYSWDVVNEPIHHDGRPDELRVKPWLDLIGPDYIEIAFRTAAAADPKAKLFLNECFIEHDVPAEAQRRDALLQLAAHLKKRGVPIAGIGVQGHIKATTPLAREALPAWMKAVRDLGLEVMITECDVDDTDIPASEIDDVVAQRYGEFLELVSPFVKVITFEMLTNSPKLPKRPDGLPHRPNLFDSNYQMMPAYTAAVKALQTAPR